MLRPLSMTPAHVSVLLHSTLVDRTVTFVSCITTQWVICVYCRLLVDTYATEHLDFLKKDSKSKILSIPKNSASIPVHENILSL